MCFRVTTGVVVVALAAGFFAGDLAAATVFLTIKILRIVMSRKAICPLGSRARKLVGTEIAHRFGPDVPPSSRPHHGKPAGTPSRVDEAEQPLAGLTGLTASFGIRVERSRRKRY